MKIQLSDSLIIVILITALLLFALVNFMWLDSVSRKMDEIESLSTTMDDSFFDRFERMEARITTCNC